MQGTF